MELFISFDIKHKDEKIIHFYIDHQLFRNERFFKNNSRYETIVNSKEYTLCSSCIPEICNSELLFVRGGNTKHDTHCLGTQPEQFDIWLRVISRYNNELTNTSRYVI